MMFPIISAEPSVRASEKTRIDGSKSFSSVEGEIVSMSVVVEGNTIDITENKYLDWCFKYPSQYTVKIIVSDATSPTPLTEEVSATITVMSKEEDNLLSEDSDLLAYEPDLYRYLPAGRSSFADVGRVARDRILSWLDEHRIWDSNGDRLTLSALMSKVEFKDWSRFASLRIIFEAQSNSIDDIFSAKALKYSKLEDACKARSAVRIDSDGDGVEDTRQEIGSIRIIR
jgi:hypothetical protein